MIASLLQQRLDLLGILGRFLVPLVLCMVLGLAAGPLAAQENESQKEADESVRDERIRKTSQDILRLLEGLPVEERREALRFVDQEVSKGESTLGDVRADKAPAPKAPARLDETPAKQDPPLETNPSLQSEPSHSRVKPQQGCELIAWLDSSGDGKVSGADRHWRHLQLWSDDNGNQEIEAKEATGLLDYDIRSIDLRLRTYEARQDVVGDILVTEKVTFRIVGKGRRGNRRNRPDKAVLVIDADDVRRSGPSLMSLNDQTGIPSVVLGTQPLRPGMLLDSNPEQGDGPKVLSCESGRN